MFRPVVMWIPGWWVMLVLHKPGKETNPKNFAVWFEVLGWNLGLKATGGDFFALKFQQLCYLSRGSSAVPELLWVCELPVPPPWCQWQKQGEETKAEPLSAKSILFQKILIFFPASLRNVGISLPDFTVLMMSNVLPFSRNENTRRVWNADSLSLLGAEGKSFSQEIRFTCVKCWNLGSWHHPA